MYASKRRQRNFKRIREPVKPGAATNPSKRHRERLNGELEMVASLLPYDASVIQRLDKLSVLRLAVSYLQIKAHFHATLPPITQAIQLPYSCYGQQPQLPYPHYHTRTIDYGNGNTAMYPPACSSSTRNCREEFEVFSLQALGGFILMLNDNGEVYYASDNVENYLGFHQSDILHQPIYDMIHSEDRDEVRQQLHWNYHIPPQCTGMSDLFLPENHSFLERNMNARFRCLLDNTCGFLRIDIRGKLSPLLGLPHSFVMGRTDPGTVLGLVAVCSPFVPPIGLDDPPEQQHAFLKSKHGLDFSLCSLDPIARCLLEVNESQLPISFFQLIHPDDAPCLAEAHKEVSKNGSSGLLVYRLISQRSQRVYWFQSSCRMFYKNGKPESIGCTHRMLTEAEGTLLLEKRASLSAKLLGVDDALLQSPKAAMNLLPSSSGKNNSIIVPHLPLLERSVYSPAPSSSQRDYSPETAGAKIENSYQTCASLNLPPPPFSTLLPPKKRKTRQPASTTAVVEHQQIGEVFCSAVDQQHVQHVILQNPDFNGYQPSHLTGLQLVIPQNEISFPSLAYASGRENQHHFSYDYPGNGGVNPAELYYPPAYPTGHGNSCQLFYAQSQTTGVPVASVEQHHQLPLQISQNSYESDQHFQQVDPSRTICSTAFMEEKLGQGRGRPVIVEKYSEKEPPPLVVLQNCIAGNPPNGFNFIADVTNALLGQ